MKMKTDFSHIFKIKNRMKRGRSTAATPLPPSSHLFVFTLPSLLSPPHLQLQPLVPTLVDVHPAVDGRHLLDDIGPYCGPVGRGVEEPVVMLLYTRNEQLDGSRRPWVSVGREASLYCGGRT